MTGWFRRSDIQPRFICAEGAVRFAAQRPPLRGLVLASSIFFVPPQAAELIHFAARPLQIATAALGCNLVPAPLAGKDMEEKTVWTRNSAVAPEKAFCFCVPFADSASRKERPSGGRLIGFPNRTTRREVILFAPVEYLAYGIRTMFVLLRAVVADAHIGHIKRCTCGTMWVSPPTNAVHLRSSCFLSAVSIGCGRETSQAKRPKVRESGA